ncbi:MAG: hypothetical protein QNK27_13505 [Desulfuromusa sp.]|nr:hypothetical protein [Desulfuromusa sp.]
MFDNLIARAIVPVTIAVTGFVIFVCILLYSFVKSDMTAEAIRNLDNCASTVVKSTRHAMMEDDQRAIQNIVENIGTRSDVGLIRIYDQAGKVRYNGSEEPETLSKTIDAHISGFLQIDPSAKENVRHEVDRANGHISVSLPILNEPKCSTAACHFHAEDEPVLGFLSVGVASENLEKTLAVLRYRMVIFSIMVLFLTVGGVTALLRMNLFLPIQRLTYNAEQAAQGVAEYDLPKSDHKLGKLNKDFRLLVKQRDQALEDLKAVESPDRNVDDGSR